MRVSKLLNRVLQNKVPKPATKFSVLIVYFRIVGCSISTYIANKKLVDAEVAWQ